MQGMPRSGEIVVVCALALLAIGVVMTSSAGMSVGEGGAVTFGTILGSNEALYAVLSVLAMLAIRALPMRRLLTGRAKLDSGAGRSPAAHDRDASRASSNLPPRGAFLGDLAPILVPVSIALMLLVYVPALSHEVNGATRWVKLPGGISFQPSEFAKWTLPVVLAWWGWRRVGVMRSFRFGLLPPLAVLTLVSAIIVMEDLGTGVLVFAVGAVVLLAAGARLWHMLALVGPVFVAGAVVGVLAEPYRVRRIVGFLNPYDDPSGTNYHMIQSLAAVAGGEGAGRGLGFGVQKFGYLPEDRTDFLFAIVCEELGLVGAAVVVALYAGLLLSGAAIARRERHPFLKLVVLGLLLTLGFQALMNLMVVTGLAPTKGIALPLLSAGGTGWLLTASSLGLLASLDRSHTPAAARERGRPWSNTSKSDRLRRFSSASRSPATSGAARRARPARPSPA